MVFRFLYSLGLVSFGILSSAQSAAGGEGLGFLSGQYCSGSENVDLELDILNHNASGANDPDVVIVQGDLSWTAITAYSYFGSNVAPPKQFLLGLLASEDGSRQRDVLVFEDGERHWLTYSGNTYTPC